jgi:hypothetical protein
VRVMFSWPPVNHDIGVAGADSLIAQTHAAHAGAAELVEAPGGYLFGNPGAHRRLPGRVWSSAGVHNLSQNDFGDFAAVHAGVSKQCPDDCLAQRVGRHAPEHAIDGTDGGTLGSYNDNIVGASALIHIDS